MLRVEPEIVENYVVDGMVSLAFIHALDHGAPSVLAHTASECAGQQNPLAFWQMHHLLFERQSSLWRANEAQMGEWATELGLDGPALQACLSDPAINEKVVRLDQSRRSQGIRLRPSFDLNGQIIQGGLPFATLAQAIDTALAQ